VHVIALRAVQGCGNRRWNIRMRSTQASYRFAGQSKVGVQLQSPDVNGCNHASFKFGKLFNIDHAGEDIFKERVDRATRE
jgi:hypothetical protein